MTRLSPTASGSLMPVLKAFFALFCFNVIVSAAVAQDVSLDADGQTHAMAMHGEPLYGPDFTHFDYVNPDAPIGGEVRFGLPGSFDSVNPLIVRGTPVWWVRGLVYESLAYRGRDEAFSLYGLLASEIILPEDRTFVTFTVDERARFSDGQPVTSDDVIFSMELLREHGRPSHRSTYGQITDVERHDERSVTFHLGDGSNRELPLLLGLMPVLPAHIMTVDLFTQTSLEEPVGSGPYRLSRVDAGRLAVFERNSDYWGADKPVNVGQYNLERVSYEYFRDEAAMFEAFARGLIHMYTENDPADWSGAYDFPAVQSGEIIQTALVNQRPKPPTGYVFNTRRELFSDVRVRQALNLLFDFEWVNQTMFFGLYERTEGYFFGSELSSVGLAASADEQALLADYDGSVLPSAMDGSWRAVQSDGSGRDRGNIRRALDLLNDAGWSLQDRRLVNANGQPFEFEFLTQTRSAERVALAYAQTLQLVGITMNVRTVDSAQFEARRRVFDFDMIPYVWYQSLSPGNEQRNRFGPSTADVEGSWNMAGITEPGVGVMIDALLAANERTDLVTAARALDRLLISGSYMIPHYHAPANWIAHQASVHFPEQQSVWGYQFYTANTLWVEE